MKRKSTKPRKGLILVKKGPETTSVRWSQDGQRYKLDRETNRRYFQLTLNVDVQGAETSLKLRQAIPKKLRARQRKYHSPFNWVPAATCPPMKDWPDEARAYLLQAIVLGHTLVHPLNCITHE